MSFNFDKTAFEKKLKETNKTILFKVISNSKLSPDIAYEKISEKFDNYNCLFESYENAKNKSRFSVIGLAPDIVWRSRNQASYINTKFHKSHSEFKQQNGNPINNLRNLIKESQINWKDFKYGDLEKLPPMSAGVFGYMNYDMVRHIEKLPNHNLYDSLNIADSIFIRPQIIIIFDNKKNTLLICTPIYHSNQNYDNLVNKINSIEEILNGPLLKKASLSKDFKFEFKSNYEKEEYCQIVKKCKNYIKDGDIFQVLPSQRFTSNYPQQIPEFSFYKSLRKVNPSPFLFFLKLDDFALAGSSPEILVSCQDKKVTIRPLAGTRRRGKNSEEDKKIANELLNDQKELAEHLMLIDLGRHDVGRVCKERSVSVTKKMEIEYYSHVMHISSTVEGKLKDNLESLDALMSGFPAGTVTGAPKIRAMEIIEEIEKTKRSFYAGCVGYFSSNLDMENCITLRSALIKNNKIYLQAGAGVVADSNEESEYQECINKAAGLIKACEKIKEL